MPDLRMRGLPRRTTIALAVMFTGLAIVVAALSSGPVSSEPARKAQERSTIIKPLDPIDRSKDRRGTKAIDPSDPFAASFGTSGRREVTVKVSSDGVVAATLYYRDRKKPQVIAVSTTHSATRTVKGRFPLAAVSIQIPGNLPGQASRATCTIIIDGVEVAHESTSEPWAVNTCVA